MKKKIGILLLTTLLIAASCTQKNPSPVNPDATPEVKALLEMFYGKRGETILSGQHNYSRSENTLTQSTDSVIARTGETPVIWGSDFNITYMRREMVQQAIHEYKKGHIITLMWHAGCPVDTIPDSINPVRYMPTASEWRDIVTPGTPFNNQLLQDIDEVAAGLKILQQENIPVLWRPYHEMNGIWFWWGNQPGEEGYEALWKIMYERFTNYHGINNLIWVWNANAPRDWENDEAYAYELFYPGHKYVDVLAADVYKKDYKQSHHDDLLELANGKLIALGEIGVPPSGEALEQQPMWSWFMMWANWPFRVVSKEDLNALYHHSSITNFGEYRHED